MKPEFTLLLALTILVSSFAAASPVEDLAAPDQAVRDKAAAELRITFKSTPESRWTPVRDKIPEGESKDGVDEALRASHATVVYAVGRIGYSVYGYRLDDEWILVCRFVDDKLTRRVLERSPKWAYIEPPEDFTGRWVIYFINGQKGEECDYKNGQKDGECITYYCDGSKQEVEHYQNGRRHGAGVAFYPSGAVTYKGQWDRGNVVGTWTFYDKDGKQTATQEHPELPPDDYTGKWTVNYANGKKHIETDYRGGKRHGDHTVFYPSGNVSCVGRYANDKEAGTWTRFDEDGVTTCIVWHTAEPPITEQPADGKTPEAPQPPK